MIIIARGKDEINQKAIEYFKQRDPNLTLVQWPKEYDLSEKKADAVYVLDLRANGILQVGFQPSSLVSYLEKLRLPTSVTDIYLISSDVVANFEFFPYAAELKMLLSKRGFDKVIIHFCTDLNYRHIFIIPPETPDGKWQVYGLKERLPNATKNGNGTLFNYDYLLKKPEKKLIWEGKNINEYFDSPQKEITKANPKLRNELLSIEAKLQRLEGIDTMAYLKP